MNVYKLNNKIIFVFLCFFYELSISQTLFDSAIKEYEKSNYKSSIKLLEECLLTNEYDKSKVYMMLGANYCMSKDYFNAKINLTNSKNLDSVNYKVYFYFGKVYLYEGFNTTAINYFSKSLNLNKINAAAYNYRAIAKLNNNDFEGVILDENSAINIDSSDYYYYYNRGLAYHQIGKLDNALSDYTKALSKNGDDKVFSNRSAIYLQVKKYANALSDIDNAIKLSPNNGEYVYFKGVIYSEMGNKKIACENFTKSELLGYKNPKDLLIKNECY